MRDQPAVLLTVGLRDYGTGEWEGGEDGCDHQTLRPARSDRPRSGLTGGLDYVAAQDAGALAAQECKCGARRVDRQIGLESTPDEFVARLVEVFREVRRVLRSDGTCFVVIGDSYHGGGYANHRINGEEWLHAHGGDRRRSRQQDRINANPDLKPKDLIGVPWLLAFALRADGWWLRSDIILAKKNPMSESVTDRPTSAHEHMFLLAKSGDAQYWTHPERPAVRSRPAPDYEWRHPETGERSRKPQPKPWRRVNLWEGRDYFYDSDAIREDDKGTDHPRSVLDGQPSLEPSGGLLNGHAGIRTAEGRNGAGRNRRNVWEVVSEPFPGAHFAVFGTKWIEPCILAGSSPKACGKCGAPWVRYNTSREVLVPEVQADPGTLGIRDRQTEVGRPSSSVPRVRCNDSEGASSSEPRTRTREGEALPGAEPYEGRRAEAALPVRRGQGADARGWSTLQADAEGPSGASSEATALGTDGARSAELTNSMCSEASATARGAGNVHGGRLDSDAGNTGSPLPLLQRAVHHGAPGDDRPCDPSNAGRTPLAGEHRGGVSSVQLPEVEPDGVARWLPSCDCNADPGHSVILDPFAGAGTTGVVALRHDRSFIGIELSPAYAEMARERIRQDQPLFNWQSEASLAAQKEGK